MSSWKLGEAKARFSDVVRLAAFGQPQHVTVRGKDTVVIVATSEFERLCARAESVSSHDSLSNSPLNRSDFDVEGVRSLVRKANVGSFRGQLASASLKPDECQATRLRNAHADVMG